MVIDQPSNMDIDNKDIETGVEVKAVKGIISNRINMLKYVSQGVHSVCISLQGEKHHCSEAL